MKLRGKQKRFLRSRANRMRPLISVGKQGLNQTWLDELVAALNRRELVKIKILQNSQYEVKDVKHFLETKTPIQVVQTIGKTLLVFMVAKKEKYRHISEQVKKI